MQRLSAPPPQSDYLNLLLAHLKISPVVLYGEEIGGRLALIHALRYPDVRCTPATHRHGWRCTAGARRCLNTDAPGHDHQDVGALILENLPAGQAAARYIARKCAHRPLTALLVANPPASRWQRQVPSGLPAGSRCSAGDNACPSADSATCRPCQRPFGSYCSRMSSPCHGGRG